MKKLVPIFFVLLISGTFLLFLRFHVVTNEGYPTWEAVRNFLIRDGEIVIALPDGVKVISAQCNDPSASVEVNNQKVITKIGYSWCTISVDTEIEDKPHTFTFTPEKSNHWNRIRFVPKDIEDPFSDFIKIENGVRKGMQGL